MAHFYISIHSYEILIKVAQIVLKNNPDWQWHIYGEGDIEYSRYIQNLIDESSLKNTTGKFSFFISCITLNIFSTLGSPFSPQ